MRRLFVAINLPLGIKEKIRAIADQIHYPFEGEIRFLPPENWHLTVLFLGYQTDESIAFINQSVQGIAQISQPPFIELNKILFGPPNKSPRMIWVMGARESSEQLAKIRLSLEELLMKRRIKFDKESRLFNAHLTLSRFDTGSINPAEIELPIIEKISFVAGSLDLMESHLKRSGAKYAVLDKHPLRLASR